MAAGAGVLDRVLDQVLEDLADALRVHRHLGKAAGHRVEHLHVAGPRQGNGGADGLGHDLGERALRDLEAVGAAVVEQLLHEVAEPVHLVVEDREDPGVGRVVAELYLEGVQVGGDREERVAHLVGHSRHELAHGGHGLALAERLLRVGGVEDGRGRARARGQGHPEPCPGQDQRELAHGGLAGRGSEPRTEEAGDGEGGAQGARTPPEGLRCIYPVCWIYVQGVEVSGGFTCLQ